MARQKGKPSGINKTESIETPFDYTPAASGKDRKHSRKQADQQEINGKLRMRHPNRNVDKNNPTNAGGYRS